MNPIVANNPSTLFSKGILNQKRRLDSKLDLGFIYTAVELWTIFGELGNPFKTSPTISQRERHAYCILFISYCLCWFYCRPLRKHVRSMTTQDLDRLMLKHLKNRIWTHVLYLVPVPHFASLQVITFRRKAPFELTAAYADEKMLPQGTSKAWPVGPVKFPQGCNKALDRQ